MLHINAFSFNSNSCLLFKLQSILQSQNWSGIEFINSNSFRNWSEARSRYRKTEDRGAVLSFSNCISYLCPIYFNNLCI